MGYEERSNKLPESQMRSEYVVHGHFLLSRNDHALYPHFTRTLRAIHLHFTRNSPAVYPHFTYTFNALYPHLAHFNS